MKKLLDAVSNNLSIVIMVLLALCFISMAASAWATDDCRGNSCNGGGGTDVDVNTDFTIGGDTTLTAGDNTASNSTHISGGRALALSNGLGDVDIAGCLGSTQWATPLFSKQKLSVNWACLAEFYLRAERYELAAIAMCNTEIRHEFKDEAECRSLHDFAPVVAAAPAVDEEHYEEEQLMHEQYADQLIEQQMQISALQEQVNKREAQIVKVVQDPEVKAMLEEAEARRAKAKAITVDTVYEDEDEE